MKENLRQIDALTATRAMAAIWVFIHHFGYEVFPFNKYPNIFRSGNLAVGYFFVLSGFVLFLNYSGRQIEYGKYMARRAARIIPVYEIALLAAILVMCAYEHYAIWSWQAFREITLSAMLLQSFVPSYPMVLNGPGWSISIEMFFYLLFPFLLRWLDYRRMFFVTATILLFVLSQYFHIRYYPQRQHLGDEIVDTIFFNPVIHISQFMIGMTAALVFRDFPLRFFGLPFLPAGLFCIVVYLVANRPDSVSYHTGMLAPLFALVIISVATREPRMLRARPLVYLGEISYGFYILQQPVHKFVAQVNERTLHLDQTILFWISLVLLIALSSLCYHLVEMPLKHRITSVAARRKRLVNVKEC